MFLSHCAHNSLSRRLVSFNQLSLTHKLAAGTSGTRFSPGTASITLPLRNMDSSTFTQDGGSTTSNGTHRIAIHVWNMTSLKWREKSNTSAYAATASVQTASFSAYAVMLIPLDTPAPRTTSANEELFSVPFIVVRFCCASSALELYFCSFPGARTIFSKATFAGNVPM
jgi:hypothetical protein